MEEINEKIIALFVEKEVLADVTEIVEYIIDTATPENCPPFDPDGIMSGQGFCTECGAPEEYLVPHTVVQGETTPVTDWGADEDERYKCPICGIGYPEPEDARDCCIGRELLVCSACGNKMSYDDFEAEIECDIGTIQQWLLVTPWLAKKLSELGETVIPEQNFWGRKSRTEDIGREDAIVQICNESGILKGQKFDWSTKLCL